MFWNLYYREDNNRLVPIILDRLHYYYVLFCEENDSQNSKPFSHLNSDKTTNDNTSVNMPPRKKSKFLYAISYKLSVL